MFFLPVNITNFSAKIISGLLIMLFIFPQCSGDQHYKADLSGIHIEPISISRYEEALFNIDPKNLRQEIDQYIDTFYIFLGEEINDSVSQKQLYDYISDPMIRTLYNETQEMWSDLSNLEVSLTHAFRYYKAHFPQASIPAIYSYVSGLDHQLPIKYFDGHLVIGLDMYMGSEYPRYQQMGVPQYKIRLMDPAYTVADVMRVMAEKHFQEHHFVPETFLDFMIYEGKILYFLDCMLPDLNDTIKIGYSAKQLDWIQNNRAFVWSYYLENEFLFSTDRLLINKFVGDAPFTAAFSRNSAPRTVAWTGWQIVREYMRRHPQKTLNDLFGESNSQVILRESRFRGK
jgi:hypothetical protein